MSSHPKLLSMTRAEAVDAVALTVMTGIAVSGLHRAFGGWEFLVIAAVAAVFGIAVAHVIDRLRLPAFVGLAMSVVVLFVIGPMASIRDEVVAGFVPTAGAFTGFVNGIVDGWRRLLTTTTPSGGAGNVYATVFLAVFACGVGTLLLARRHRSLASLLLLPGLVLAGSVLFGDRRPFSVLTQGAVLTAVGVAWLAIRRSRERKNVIHSAGTGRVVGGVAMLAVMGVAGMVVGPNLPMTEVNDRYVLRDDVEPPFDPRELGSPLNAYQRYLIGELKETELFTISGLPESADAQYVRLATMDDYDGVVWRVSPRSGTQGGRFIRVGESVPIDVEGTEFDVDITMQGLPGGWMPGLGSVTSVRWTGSNERDTALRDRFRLSTVTSTGVVTNEGGWQDGDSYSLSVVVPTLARTDVVDSDIDRNVLTEVSSPIPQDIKTLANAVTKGKQKRYEQVAAIYDFLRKGYYASGDEESDQSNAPGHSYGRVLKFIENALPIGNAEQYAASMALMLRSLDIPARVVMGFRVQPGQTVVKGSDAWAWVEVGFADGWVMFDPTNDKNTQKPKNQQQKPKPFFESQNVPPPPVVPPEPDVSPRQTDEIKKNQAEKDKRQRAKEAGVSQWVVVGGVAAGTPVVLLGGFATVVGLLKRHRRRRRRRAPVVANRVAGGWAEFVDTARDFGLAVVPRSTRRETALMIAVPKAGELAASADAIVFGGGEPDEAVVDDYWNSIAEASRELRSQRSLRTRIAALFSTASLRSLA